MSVAGKHTVGCRCCITCNCLRYKEGKFMLWLHLNFPTYNNGIEGVTNRGFCESIHLLRPDATSMIWSGTLGFVTLQTRAGLYLPKDSNQTIKKARIVLWENETTTPTLIENFQTLGTKRGTLWECRNNKWVVLEDNGYKPYWSVHDYDPAEVEGVSGYRFAPNVLGQVYKPVGFHCNSTVTPLNLAIGFQHWVDSPVPTLSGTSAYGFKKWFPVFNRSELNHLSGSLGLRGSIISGINRVDRYNYDAFDSSTNFNDIVSNMIVRGYNLWASRPRILPSSPAVHFYPAGTMFWWPYATVSYATDGSSEAEIVIGLKEWVIDTHTTSGATPLTMNINGLSRFDAVTDGWRYLGQTRYTANWSQPSLPIKFIKQRIVNNTFSPPPEEDDQDFVFLLSSYASHKYTAKSLGAIDDEYTDTIGDVIV